MYTPDILSARRRDIFCSKFLDKDINHYLLRVIEFGGLAKNPKPFNIQMILLQSQLIGTHEDGHSADNVQRYRQVEVMNTEKYPLMELRNTSCDSKQEGLAKVLDQLHGDEMR